MITLVDYLTAARDKIADRNHWVQGTIAETKDGDIVDAKHTNAAKWCAIGSWRSVIPQEKGYFDPEGLRYYDPIYLVTFYNLEEEFNVDIVEINDESCHEEVINTYDLFIEEAQKWNFV